MSAFTEAAGWYKPAEGITYVTTKPLTWEIGMEGSGLFYTVPVGAVFDVSIPWGLRWVLDPRDPRFHKAACIHDHMLEAGWDRPSAGGAFHAALKASGVGILTRLAMFFAVTLWKWR